MLIAGSTEAAELSFLLFLLPAGLVFDRAVVAFVVFHFHSLEKKSWSHYWSHCTRGSKVETRSCLRVRKCAKIERMLVGIQRGPSFLCKWESFLMQIRVVRSSAVRPEWVSAWRLRSCVEGCHVIRWRGIRAWSRGKGRNVFGKGRTSSK